MKHFNLRKNLNTAVWIGGTILSASPLADTQQGGSGPDMMDDYGTALTYNEKGSDPGIVQLASAI